ncbi:hypothetical protein GL50803_0021234 [Giardia duodenalis]|uniref:Uncharacterized protein n=1 Tax=Giardia intestinalis (strain ATCC 50803 / WB clone C6) TaxID=184922 RepID=A8BXY2_GIAIC|nr:hypothetical protein GL50803_0021234 [Giardia intestinalis]KAE8304811.1 hypothetical protein GL50803_0021234 [Giardia intestinalis]|eukprot:XP_001704242.1 Hypothetical protein GL50803_21234 [Giardia lamblia ATCC 50803]
MAAFADWLQKAQSLAVQEKNAVTALHSSLEQSSTRGLNVELRTLRQADVLAIAERISESRKVKQHLDRLQFLVQQLGLQLTSNASIEDIKEHVQLLDKQLYGARQGWEQANDNLLSREEELRGAVTQAEVRFATLEKLSADSVAAGAPRLPVKRTSSAPASSSQRPFARDVRPRALQLIEEEMERLGGRTGGWDPADHDKFYSYWKMSGQQTDKHRFVKDIQKHFPLYTLAALVAHNEFMVRYDELNNQRKRYIERWRANQATNLDILMQGIQDPATLTHSKAMQARKTTQEKILVKERLRALQERKNMDFENNLAIGLRRKRRLQREASNARRALRKRALTARAKKTTLIEDQPSEPVEDLLCTSAEQQRKIQELRRQRRAELELLKKRHEDQIQAAAQRRKQQEEAHRRRSLASRDTELAEHAKRVQPLSIQQIKRDPARIMQQTAAMEANKKVLEEAKKRRESGENYLVNVTQGFDPFNPFLGGLAQPLWMH